MHRRSRERSTARSSPAARVPRIGLVAAAAVLVAGGMVGCSAEASTPTSSQAGNPSSTTAGSASAVGDLAAVTDRDREAAAAALVSAVATATGCTELRVDGSADLPAEAPGTGYGRCRAPGLAVGDGIRVVADSGFRIVSAQENQQDGAWSVQAIDAPAISDGPVDTLEVLWVDDDGGLLSITVNGPLVRLDADEGWTAVSVPEPTTEER